MYHVIQKLHNMNVTVYFSLVCSIKNIVMSANFIHCACKYSTLLIHSKKAKDHIGIVTVYDSSVLIKLRSMMIKSVFILHF